MKYTIIACALIFIAACSTTPNKGTQTGKGAPANPSIAQTQGPITLTITSPTAGEVVKSSDVSVVFDLKNYQVQPDGQHIHVIVDNEAYQPCYSVAEPFILKNLKPGIHTLRAFPARAWHESIKEPGAFAFVTFYVEKKTGKTPVDFSKPLLTYSRPKGKYEGAKADKILFDFLVKNAEIGTIHDLVKYTLDNDDSKLISEWKPNYFENLPTGKHKLIIELVDMNGKPIKGKYNKTEREFEVAR